MERQGFDTQGFMKGELVATFSEEEKEVLRVVESVRERSAACVLAAEDLERKFEENGKLTWTRFVKFFGLSGRGS